ncbi:hypothetical protein [Propionicicella superfundia]|uniref:hypothetical protein n=1 Tax=Propionicicella superfundia TaxID=348582 RepID=UPI00040EF75E|nr:hypothetical protein [Propionicicella superfundia]
MDSHPFGSSGTTASALACGSRPSRGPRIEPGVPARVGSVRRGVVRRTLVRADPGVGSAGRPG